MSNGRYKPYPEYHDSGVDWLGGIPGHWNVEPFKRQVERNDGGVWGNDPDGKNDTIVLRSTEQTVDGHWQLDDPAPRKLTRAEIEGALLLEGDLLLTKSSGSSLHIGKTTLVTAEVAALRCCYSNFMQRIRTKPSFLPKLAWYVLNNELARRQLDLLSNSTTGLANLNATMVGQILVICPPLPEQTQIAKFLDHETAKIDRLIEKQEALIRLLKEKRQAVIGHAVTKGLNPHAPLKDSGIAWLGQVPAHWKTSKLGYSARIANGATPSRETPAYWENGTIGWLNSGKINDVVITEADQFITKRAVSETSVQPVVENDLLIAITGEGQTRGRVAICKISATINQHLASIRIHDGELNQDFLFFWLTAQYDRIRFESSEGGSTKAAITCASIAAYPVPIPPMDEQIEIVAHLEKNRKRLDEVEALASEQITLLQERRTAMISAAVTGKIDVRHWQPPAESGGD